MQYYSIQRLGNYPRDDRELRVSEKYRSTVGAAADVGLQLRSSFGLPAVCLEVWMEADKCLAQNVSGNARLILLNGHPFYSVGQLEHGDLLEIGDDQFAVVYRDETPPEPVVSPVLPVAAEPEEVEPEPYVPATFLNSVAVNSAVMRHEPRDAQWELVDVLKHLAEQFQAFVFANFRHAGARGPQGDEFGDDLFQHAPEEVRAIYSLHAIGDVAVGQKLKVYADLKDKDAAVWVVPEDDLETCVKDAKIYLAWFARPSVLQMTLQQSPRVFTEALLKPFRAIVLRSADDGSWVIYTKSDFDPAGLRLEQSVGTPV